MEQRVGDVPVRYVEHGEGASVLVLHGAGVDHREPEACFDAALAAGRAGRRIYPDLPGMGRTPAPPSLRSADDVLEMLYGFTAEIAEREPVRLVGHSVGGYYAHGFAARWPERVAGLALVCPLLPGVRDVPGHLAVVPSDLGDDGFRGYFVQQTPAMLDRYERFVAPAEALVDQAAMERLGDRWELTLPDGPAYAGPVLIVAGRQDSTVGYAAAVDLLDHYPHATLAVLDGAGHALPHEQADPLAGLLAEWLSRSP